MVGGYLTFAGIEGRARWAGTPVEAALPVTIASGDDRVEVPAGPTPAVRLPDHPIAAGLPAPMASLLGYNRVPPKRDAAEVVAVGERPAHRGRRIRRGTRRRLHLGLRPSLVPSALRGVDGYARCGSSWWPG